MVMGLVKFCVIAAFFFISFVLLGIYGFSSENISENVTDNSEGSNVVVLGGGVCSTPLDNVEYVTFFGRFVCWLNLRVRDKVSYDLLFFILSLSLAFFVIKVVAGFIRR